MNLKTLMDACPNLSVVHVGDKPKLGYIGGFRGKRVEVYADSLLDAKQKAIAALGVTKRQAHLVWVLLAEKDGQPVVHHAVD